ncbi:hypothetical protein C0991_004140 [Blastosporella zonata]|nr:hypothetical protein C0991_004140 [Blastosporella zonata]
MPGLQLSAEICSKIVRSVSPRRAAPDLAALCLTCKAFQRESEIKLYESLYFTDVTRAHLACRTFSRNQRLALLVHTFWFNDESRRPSPIPRQFWSLVQIALSRMHNLGNLALFDVSHANSWVLNPTHIKFQLHEATLHFNWDAPLVRFLEGQKKLQRLHTFDRIEDARRIGVEPAAGSLPVLKRFEGTLMIAQYTLSSPLTHLQVTLDEGVTNHLLDFLSRLWSTHKTLRSLSIIDLTEGIAPDALHIIVSICPNLLYLGLIPLPPIHVRASLSPVFHKDKDSRIPLQRHHIYQSLIRMHSLTTIQLEVSSWSPPPDPRAQRSIASEVRTFCPSVRHVIFWLGATRHRWFYGHQWNSSVEMHQYPQFDTMWTAV